MKKIIYSLLLLGTVASTSSASIKDWPAKGWGYTKEHPYKVGVAALGSAALTTAVVYDLTRGEKSLIIKALKETGALSKEGAHRLAIIAKKHPVAVFTILGVFGVSGLGAYQYLKSGSCYNNWKEKKAAAEQAVAEQARAEQARAKGSRLRNWYGKIKNKFSKKA